MVDVALSNNKLFERATLMVSSLADVDKEEARLAVLKSIYRVDQVRGREEMGREGRGEEGRGGEGRGKRRREESGMLSGSLFTWRTRSEREERWRWRKRGVLTRERRGRKGGGNGKTKFIKLIFFQVTPEINSALISAHNKVAQKTKKVVPVALLLASKRVSSISEAEKALEEEPRVRNIIQKLQK
jgi:hypothetical protein